MTALDRITPAARAILEEAGLATEEHAQHLLDQRGDWPSLTDAQADLLRRTSCPLPFPEVESEAS
jgi:hypothetical protein